MDLLLGYTVAGLVTAAIYAIAASGLVVTYATSGVFNIAHGAIGMIMAFVYWELRVGLHWPAPAALVLVIVVLAPTAGLLIERMLIRGLENASVETSLVVTIALTLGLIGAAQSIWKTDARQISPFFGVDHFSIAGIDVTWHQAITMAVAIAVAVGLWLFLYHTRRGIVMRAAVDDRTLLQLNGISFVRVSQLSWAMGASLAATAGILLAPDLTLDIQALTLLVVDAYAAAMLGRLRSLPLTFLGAVILGLAQSYAIGYLPLSGAWSTLGGAIPTILFFVALVLVPQARLLTSRISVPAIPRAPSLRGSLVRAVVFVAGAAVLSTFLSEANITRLGSALGIAIIGLSLVLLTGYGGHASLATMTFAGLGAFAMAKLGHGGSPVGVLAAAGIGVVAGALVALPVMKLRGLYLALSTMAFATLMDVLFFPNAHIFGTYGSATVARLNLFGLSFAGDRTYFVFLAACFALLGVAVLAIRRSRFGMVLSAVRDSQAGALSVGLQVRLAKLAVVAVSSGFASLGGALLAGLRTSAGASDFAMFQSLLVMLLIVIGGVTTVSGAFVGGIFFSLFPYLQQELIPSLNGFVFLGTALAGISVARRPNGVAFDLARHADHLIARFRNSSDRAGRVDSLAAGVGEKVSP